jgi:hypothetical protein
MRRGAALAVALGTVACGAGGGAPPPAPGGFAALAEGAPELRMALFPQAPDSAGAVRVALVFYNGGEPVELPYNEQRVAVQVFGPDGRELTRETDPLFDEANLPLRRFSLERGEMFAAVVDLACAFPRPAAAGSGPPACGWKFDFSRPGTYRMVGYYQTIAPPDVPSPVPGRDFLRLRSDTASVVIR